MTNMLRGERSIEDLARMICADFYVRSGGEPMTGTSAYMIGNSIEDQILESGNWGVGAAMSFLMLIVSAVLALVAYRVGKLNRLETAA